jgi:Uma2 family endonuclease
MLRWLGTAATPMTTTTAHKRRWTYADYCRIPPDRRRHEILDGRHFVNPAPNPRHQTVGLRLAFELMRLVEKPGRGRVFVAPIDVHLGPGTIVQPDLVVLHRRHEAMIGPTKITGVPDLLIEVLSPSNRRHDTERKRERYERAGVREFWLVDPDARCIEQLLLQRRRYRLAAIAEHEVRLRLLRGVAIDLREVWG